MIAFALSAGATLLRSSAPTARALRHRAFTSPPTRSVFLTGAAALIHSPPSRAHTTMRVATDGDTVCVHYVGTLESGEQFDSSREREDPLSFVLGSGSVVPGFEAAVRGMAPGATKRAVLSPTQAYGERTDELVMAIPRVRAPEGLALDVGQKVPLTNGAMATVLGVTEGEIKLDANHELAGKTLVFDLELVEIKDGVLGKPAEGTERVVFGLGCFWGGELLFQRVEGVVATKVGYTQGKKTMPTYSEVCSGRTGHTEAIAVDFDPKKVSMEEIMDLFWRRLGPNAFTLNQVGNDRGTQYRSGIYYSNEKQREIAEATAKKIGEQSGKKVIVEIKPEDTFYLGEDYHQRYLEKGGQDAEKGADTPIRCYG